MMNACIHRITLPLEIKQVFCDNGAWLLPYGGSKSPTLLKWRCAGVAATAHWPTWRCSRFQIDPETDRQTWGAAARLAEQHQLTLYDAAYLELALRRGLPLATLHRDLRAAANAEKVRLLGM